MTIQQFAMQLKQEEGAAPLLQSLQALRNCSLDQVWAALQDEGGWIPWGVAATPETSNALA